jgi:hypothetical protein
MRERAADLPGYYFVFCVASQQVLASIDTNEAVHSDEPSHLTG